MSYMNTTCSIFYFFKLLIFYFVRVWKFYYYTVPDDLSAAAVKVITVLINNAVGWSEISTLKHFGHRHSKTSDSTIT